MFELKPISREAIPEALDKVERYRLLNEPSLAESICLDVLEVEPQNQRALVMLLLSLTDQLGHGVPASRAREILPKLSDEYERAYYSGLVSERWALAHLKQGAPGAGFTAYTAFHDAMDWYEKAQKIRPPANDDSILRWNTCARILMRNPELRPRPEETFVAVLDD